MRHTGRQVESVAFPEIEVTRFGMEHDRPAQAEEDLVLVMLMPRVAVAGTVRP